MVCRRIFVGADGWLKIPSRTVELLTDGSSEGLTKILSCKGEVLEFFFPR